MKKKPILTESWLLFVYNNTERQKTIYRSAKAKDMKPKVLHYFSENKAVVFSLVQNHSMSFTNIKIY